jgi:SAM-dependent methyltransferase
MTTAPATTPPQARDAPPPCLYCGYSSYSPLFENLEDRLGYVPGRWAFWRCRECRSAVLSPFPKADQVAAFYPPVYSFRLDLGRDSAWRRFFAQLEYRLYFGPQYEAQVKRVLRGVGWRDGAGRRLLDVGCGRGLRLMAFRRRGFDVQGMDLQPDVVEFLRKELEVPAVCADIQELATCFSPESFDLITAFFVLEHVPSVAAVLENCFRLLKPGGWFVGAVPFIDSVQAGLFKDRWINATEAPRHLSLPTRTGMEIVCRRTGYDQISVHPDSTLNCAGQVGISLFPGGTITHFYGGGRLGALVQRVLAGTATMLSIPFCAVENRVLRRPSLGMVFAHKPDRHQPRPHRGGPTPSC